MASSQGFKPVRQGRRNRVFGILVGSNELLYDTLSSNPSKSLRAYNRLGRIDNKARVGEFEMKRAVSSSDVLSHVGRLLWRPQEKQ